MPNSVGRDSSGIALFMVLASVAMLTVLVTEFVYISQISQSIAFAGVDQIKAHYLAKSGLKISLLRLKAFQNVKSVISSMMPGGGAGGGSMVPNGMIQQVWSFPFMYPIPTNLPGMTPSDKEMIDKFQKESSFDGSYTAVITSESSKYNLNLLIAPAPAPSTSPSNTPSGTPTTAGTNPPPPGQPQTTPNPNASFSPQQARDGLYEFLNTILLQKFQDDPDFANNYRDFKLNEFIDTLAAWSDRKYERQFSPNQDKVPMKRAPFYSLSELHMLPAIDDDLFQLFSENLTVSPTPGININTMKEGTLRALAPGMTIDEVKEFFKYRDATDVDHLFTDPKYFYDYLSKNCGVYKNQQAISDLQARLAKAGITLVTDESQFKITVRATVNNSVRTIEAWVTLGTATQTSQTSTTTNPPSSQPPGVPNPGSNNGQTNMSTDPGLRITFMRIL